jgi:hypothetical protein
VSLKGAARGALVGAQIRVRFDWMRLDPDKTRETAAFGAGWTDIGRGLRQLDSKCAHAMTVRRLKGFATNTFLLLVLPSIRLLCLSQFFSNHTKRLKIHLCSRWGAYSLLSKELKLHQYVILCRMGQRARTGRFA